MTLYNMAVLKERSRDLILHFLQKVEDTGDPQYVPLLRAGERVDCNKVQQRIREVIRSLEGDEVEA